MKNAIQIVFYVFASLITVGVISVARMYPCLEGAGMAMIGFEMFLIYAFVSIPCLVWSIVYFRQFRINKIKNNLVKTVMVSFIGLGNLFYVLISMPLIFSYSNHSLYHVFCN